METDSENRGRGRPQKFPPELMRMARAQTHAASQRTVMNRAYAGLAAAALLRRYEGDERLDWLISDERARWSLLTELGRLLDARGDEAMYEAADWLLENRPKAKDAEAVIRLVRTGRQPPASIKGLYRVLKAALDNYRITHEFEDSQVEAALGLLLNDVREGEE